MSLAVTALLLLIAQIEEHIHDPVAVAETANELRQALLVAEQDPVGRLNLSTTIELERIVPLSAAALLRGVSVDTIARHFKAHIILTGSKMRGIRIKHVLELGGGTSRLPSPRRKRTQLVTPRKRRFGQGSTKPASDVGLPKAHEPAAAWRQHQEQTTEKFTEITDSRVLREGGEAD